jgi:hypothetical protein
MNKIFRNKKNKRIVYFKELCTIEGYVEETKNDSIFTIDICSDDEDAILYEDRDTHKTFTMPLLAFLNTYEVYDPADDLLSVAKKYTENATEDYGTVPGTE